MLKSDKIDYQKPGAELGIRELGIPNLDKSSQAMPKPALAQNTKRALFQANGVLFEGTGGGFLEISSTEIVKTISFLRQEALFEERSFPMSLFRGPEPNK